MGLFSKVFGRRRKTISEPFAVAADKIAQVNLGTGPVTQNLNFRVEPTAPLPSSIPKPRNFIGRNQELEFLVSEFRNGKRRFVISGLGGIGKTELARAFATEIASNYKAFLEIQ